MSDSPVVNAVTAMIELEIVKREPTEKMMRSACELDCPREICDAEGKCAHETRWQIYADTWRYMLAAAQENDDGR